LLLITTANLGARIVQPWSYRELLEKSHVVAIGIPTATNDTKERIPLPGFVHQPVIGVETQFRVLAMLKGNPDLKALILHHYRPDGLVVPNGPDLVSFDPEAKHQPYLLFLVRETDGRYAPAFGQVDPAMCGISALQGSSASLVTTPPPPVPDLSERLRDIDFVAFVSITNVTKTFSSHGTTNLFAFGTADRILKGALLPQYPFKIRQPTPRPDFYWTSLETGRFLIFGTWSGDSCVPRGYYALAPVIGTGLDTDRVLWPNCNSVSEVVAAIKDELSKR